MASHKNNSHNKKTPVLPSQQPRSLIVANEDYLSKFSDAKFTLSFEYFDEKKCDFDGMKASQYKKFIRLLEGLSECKTVNDFHSKCPMEIKPIENTEKAKTNKSDVLVIFGILLAIVILLVTVVYGTFSIMT